MALVTCKECGKEISDIAQVCPNCGYPIQAVKNAQIDKKNREYYKNYNIRQLLINILLFAVTFYIGYHAMAVSEGIKLWAWGVFIVCGAIVLFLCWSWIPYMVLFIVHISQEYKHIPRGFFLVTMCFGYVIGGAFGIGS